MTRVDPVEALTTTLTDRAEGAPDPRPDYDAIASRANRLRRARWRIPALAAAAIGIVLIPASALLGDTNPREPGPGPVPNGTTPRPSQLATAPPPIKPQSLELARLDTGDPPRVDWVHGHSIHRANRSTLDPGLDNYLEAVVPTADGWIISSSDSSESGLVWTGDEWVLDPDVDSPRSAAVVHVSTDGTATTLGRNYSTLAASSAGQVVAWVSPSGEVMAAQGNQHQVHRLGRIPGDGYYSVRAVTTEDCSPSGDCVILVNSDGREGGAYMVSADGTVQARRSVDHIL